MLDDIKHFTYFFVPRQILKECYSPENYLTLKISRIQSRMMSLLLFGETWIIDFRLSL
jgi:hypothetical protein